MEDGGGNLRYKCRSCGVIFEPVHVGELHRSLLIIAYGYEWPKTFSTVKPQMVAMHSCAAKVLGIADLIGGRYAADSSDDLSNS